MNIIVAADRNWGIGYKGNLLTHIKEDMRFFKEKTINKAVIMGRETFLSLPGQKALSDRENFVLTTNKLIRDNEPVTPYTLDEVAKIITMTALKFLRDTYD